MFGERHRVWTLYRQSVEFQQVGERVYGERFRLANTSDVEMLTS